MGRIFSSQEFLTRIQDMKDFFLGQPDLSKTELEADLKETLDKEFAQMYRYMDQSQCLHDLKQHEQRIRDAYSMLNYYANYTNAGRSDLAQVYMTQFLDFCSGGKCFESLSTILTALDGSTSATSNCDILNSLYEYGEILDDKSKRMTGNRAVILLRGGMLLDIINKGIIVESSYAWHLQSLQGA